MGRMLSAIPPSTATRFRPSGVSFTVPTRYSVTIALPTTDRPGSTRVCGIRRPRRDAPSRTRASRAGASRSSSRGRSSVYDTPNPPPRSTTSASNPVSRFNRSSKSSTTSTAARYGSGSRTWEPMWAWTPAGCTLESSMARRMAPPTTVRGMPNFVPAVPVRMASWAPALTPGITRRRTLCTTPAARAIGSSRSSSAGLSTFTSHRPLDVARRSSSSDLLLPWKAMRSPGIPAARQAWSSPPVATSRFNPSSATSSIMARDVNAFTAYSGWGKSLANARHRFRMCSSSATSSGVPYRAARSSASTPPIDRPTGPNRAFAGQGPPAAASGSGIDPLHRLRGRHAEEGEHVRDGLLGPRRQPQAGLGQGFVVGDDPAVGVEAVEPGGQLLSVMRKTVRAAEFGRPQDQVRHLGDRPQQVELGVGRQQRQVGLLDRLHAHAPLLRVPQDAGDPCVAVLDVVHGVVHAPPLHVLDVEVHRRVVRVHEQREPRGVGAHLVDELVQPDEGARPLAHFHRLATPQERHELVDDHLDGGRIEPHGLGGPLHPDDVTVVVGAPHIDHAVEPPGELVDEVGTVRGEVRVRPVAPDQRAVLVVPERRRSEPHGSLGLVHISRLAEPPDGRVDLPRL